MKRILSRQNTYLIGILVPLLLAVTACASTPASTPAPKDSYTIMTMTKIGLGNYLVDAKGMTLYYYANDSTGKSNASDAVIANWPIFYVDDVVAPPNMNASDFGTIIRDDGKMQTTYKGWPLYYYIKDQAPGDTMGQRVNGAWFIIDPHNFPPINVPPY